MPPLSPTWWAVHLAVVAVVVPTAWLLAGAAAVLERRAAHLSRIWPLPALAAALGGGLVVLDLSVTGFATWHGPGMLGVPSSTVPLLLVLWLCWQSALQPAKQQPGPGRG